MAPSATLDPNICLRKLTQLQPEEEIVISGIAGRFPESDNVKHLHENLIAKTDLVTNDDRRWKLDHPEIPQRMGKINKIEKFDSLFFGVHSKQAHAMDPACRMLLEHAYEAVIDAGINPRQIRGTKTGVFIGAGFSESEKTWFYEKHKVDGFGIIGCARSMLANRISYWFGINGPSYTIDSACSSSSYALENAYRAIREGLCDAAIVGGANLCLQPYVSMQYFKLGTLSLDGRCKTFDEDANGYVRSEAISVVFLQKTKDAKRIYATLVHSKINCDGFKEQGITFPSTSMQGLLLKEFYSECGIPPSAVNYIEAHGTGTKVGDTAEVTAIDNFFCQNRSKNNPLLIGSVKSNLGHSEPASGLVSLTKVVLAMESGKISPNINFQQPRKEIKSIIEGRIQVVTDVISWKGEYAGVNSSGFGGANAHFLLRMHSKQKINNAAPNDDLPRLVVVSGRTEEAVHVILSDLESKAIDVEYIRLLHDIHSDNISGHPYKGYTILPAKGVAEIPVREIESVSGTKRPVWFVFSGVGSQWPAMGKALLQIPIFFKAITTCDTVLKPYGIDIFHVITSENRATFDNILNVFVGIAAVQIGLVNILHSVGIEADNIIGHSVGELGCAYADGCFTAEQMILSAYLRGLACTESKIPNGTMAAVGLGHEQLKPICPPDIDIACHNASNSTTISGPTESIKTFMAELQAKNIFVREVSSSNIPYHSRYIASVGPKLLSYLQKIIPDPKARSSKWLSTSVPIDQWNEHTALHSSAEYHTNNLLSPVLFEEISALIPQDAVVIEIAPHGLLQAILRRSLDPNITNVALTQRGHSDNVEVLLKALGKMFNVGLNLKLANLYPPVKYPVSRATQMISPLIRWQHSDNWHVALYNLEQKRTSGERTVKISLTDKTYKFMAGHVIDGRILLPAAGYLILIWESLAMMFDEFYSNVSVVFKDVKFLRATPIPKTGEVELTLTIQKGTGRFAVVESDVAIVTGIVYRTKSPQTEKIKRKVSENPHEELMTSRDIYKELGIRGYNCTDTFCSIYSSTIDGTKGQIVWHDWVTFIENMLQLKAFSIDTRSLLVSTFIKKLLIDVNSHLDQRKCDHEGKNFPVYIDKLHDVIISGGVEIHGLKCSTIMRKKQTFEPVLEEYKFIPFTDRAEMNLCEIVKLTICIALENHADTKVKTVELVTESDKVSVEDLLSPYISKAFDDIPLIQAEIIIYDVKKKINVEDLSTNIAVLNPEETTKDANALIVIGKDLLTHTDNLNLLICALKQNGFLLTRENTRNVKNVEKLAQSRRFSVIFVKKYGQYLFVLLKKQEILHEKTYIVHVCNEKFEWITKMRSTLNEVLKNNNHKNTRVYFIGQGDSENGLISLIDYLKKELGNEIIRGILIQDPKAAKFDLENPLYLDQIKKDLIISVLRENGTWGTYVHLPLPPAELKLVRHGWVNQTVRGDLSSFAWFEGPIDAEEESENIIDVYYCSVNSKDVMLATGKLTTDIVGLNRSTEECVIGFEYSGIDITSKRVMGMLQSRGLANLCIKDPDLCWEIPDHWTLEDAATVPYVYATCYYGLYSKGKMKEGDKVLIHSGSGGIGQAAIYLALQEGCEVFTTVGTPEKRQFIRKTFPQIKDDHIGNSRDTSFEQLINEQTNGRGVDIVLNSLTEDKILASVACLAWGGQFLQIGKFDFASNNLLGLDCFSRGISFHSIQMDKFTTADGQFKKILRDFIVQGLQNGAIQPITRNVFSKDQVEAAFRFMAAGKHIGKVIIKVKDEKILKNTKIQAYPRYYCLKDRSYLILSGLDDFGLELADWLVLRGAKNLVFTSRSGLESGYQKMRVELWKSYGCNIVIVVGKDASVLKDCQSIVETASKLAPVDAIFNLAMMFRNDSQVSETSGSFEKSFRSNVWTTKNLDVVSKKSCPLLRHFVVFSSTLCGTRGETCQIAYAMSNSVVQQICEKRVSEKLPGLSIQWGIIGEPGSTRNTSNQEKITASGMSEQSIASCLHVLDGFLQQNRPILSSMVVAEKKTDKTNESFNMVDRVINIMGLKDLKSVNLNTPFAEFGVDSMMSVEIRQTLEREFDVSLNNENIQSLNFSQLIKISAEKNLEKNKK